MQSLYIIKATWMIVHVLSGSSSEKRRLIALSIQGVAANMIDFPDLSMPQEIENSDTYATWQLFIYAHDNNFIIRLEKLSVFVAEILSSPSGSHSTEAVDWMHGWIDEINRLPLFCLSTQLIPGVCGGHICCFKQLNLLATDKYIEIYQSRRWVTQIDPWPAWPMTHSTHDPWVR